MPIRNLTILEFIENENISRSSAYREINSGRLKVIHVGRRVLVPVEFADDWRERLKRDAA